MMDWSRRRARRLSPRGASFGCAGPGLALVLLATCACAAQAERPVWWDNDLGREEIVLPGFAPVRVDGTELRLGSRRYVWDGGFLPSRIDARGARLTRAMRLVVRRDGERRELAPYRVSVTQAKDHHAVVESSGEPLDGLRVEVETRVEYDGVALVTLSLRPERPVRVEGLEFVVDVERRPTTRMLRFAASTIRGQSRRHDIRPRYRGEFLNIVGFPDGERSFWWFADDAKGWIWNGPVVTEVEPLDRIVRLRQHLIGGPYTIEKPLVLHFNFMATPVRDLGTSWRRDRVVSAATARWKGLGSFHLWWDTVFAHIVVPYTQLPPEMAAKVPAADRKAYPGRERNRELMREYPREYGFHRIPYFSAHVLSTLDPVLLEYREQWEVVPPFVNKAHHRKRTTFDKPTLSHRAESYRNYLLHRFDQEIDNLDMPGIYFDQAKVIDSRNPHGAAWTDSQGRVQPSVDVLGTRDFLKRLRVLFHRHGQPGWIFVHNSNGEIPPAYAFATSWVVGEEFRHHLAGDDYIGSITLDEVRTQFSPHQFGIRCVWIPQFFSFHKHERNEWKDSEAERRATRNFLALALLHDVEVLPAIHFGTWKSVVATLDRFGVSGATFRGYWTDSGVHAEEPEAAVSLYRKGDELLLVAANLTSRDRSVTIELDRSRLPWTDDVPLVAHRSGGERQAIIGERFRVRIPARDFALLWITPGGRGRVLGLDDVKSGGGSAAQTE